jgi:Spy/CpxP family protein refolding chaperone
MHKLLTLATLVAAAFALPVHAASHAGAAPMPPASGAMPADAKKGDMKKDGMKKEEMKKDDKKK